MGSDMPFSKTFKLLSLAVAAHHLCANRPRLCAPAPTRAPMTGALRRSCLYRSYAQTTMPAVITTAAAVAAPLLCPPRPAAFCLGMDWMAYVWRAAVRVRASTKASLYRKVRQTLVAVVPHPYCRRPRRAVRSVVPNCWSMIWWTMPR